MVGGVPWFSPDVGVPEDCGGLGDSDFSLLVDIPQPRAPPRNILVRREVLTTGVTISISAPALTVDTSSWTSGPARLESDMLCS